MFFSPGPQVVTIDPLQGIASQRMAEIASEESSAARLICEREAVRQWGLFSAGAAHAAMGGDIKKGAIVGDRTDLAFELVGNTLNDPAVREALAAGGGILNAPPQVAGAFHAVALNRTLRLLVSSSKSRAAKAIDPVIFDVTALPLPGSSDEVPPGGVMDLEDLQDLLKAIPQVPGLPGINGLGVSPLAIVGITVVGIAAVVGTSWTVDSVLTADSEVQIERDRAHANAQAMVASEIAIAKIKAGQEVDVPPLIASLAAKEHQRSWLLPTGVGVGIGLLAAAGGAYTAHKKGWI